LILFLWYGPDLCVFNLTIIFIAFDTLFQPILIIFELSVAIKFIAASKFTFLFPTIQEAWSRLV